MNENLHLDKKNALYISEPNLERLEDLEDNVPKAPKSDSEILDPVGAEFPKSQEVIQVEPLQDVQFASTPRLNPIVGITIFGSVGVLVLVFVVQCVLAITQTLPTIKTAFENCLEGGKVVAQIPYAVCTKDGLVSQGLLTPDQIELSERSAGALGVVSYTNSTLASIDRSIVTNAPSTGNLGIAVYTLSGDTFGKMVVNNTYLTADQNYNNDFAIQKVRLFVDKNAEFTVSEPLGSESLVLKAFQTGTSQAQSKTLDELTIQVKNLDKSRAIWGVDGSKDQQYTIKARMFGYVRSNVIMVETGVPFDTQQKILTTKLLPCQQKFKSLADIQNCYNDALKSDTELVNSITGSLSKALEGFGL